MNEFPGETKLAGIIPAAPKRRRRDGQKEAATMDCGTLGAAAASPGKHGAAAAAAPGKAEEAAGRDSVSWLSPHFAWGGRAKLVVCRARQAGAAAASMLGVGGAAAAAAAAWGGIARPLTRETPDLPGFGEPLAPLWRGLDARECICATTASCACHWQSARHLSTVSSIFRNMNMMIHLRSCRIYLLCCLVFACFISSLAEDHAAGSHQANVRLDRNMVQDKDHIMEHLEGVIDKPESEMSPQELQLHYFKMHDYDGNNLLDGLELATAISHVHKEEGGEHTQIMKEDDLISLIDDVLQDDDKNNDGYIDYAEFAKSLE